MLVALVTLTFWTAVAAAVAAQVMILRSTRRVLAAAAPQRPALEWAFALLPAGVLLVVLVLSWRAAMAPPTIDVTLPAPPGTVQS
jgi:hypothetical protein